MKVNKNSRYNIDNYFVGILEIVDYKFLNRINDYSNELKRRPKNIAIDITNKFGTKNNYILTLFYKENSDLICLHNVKLSDSNKVRELLPLKQFLPKIDFNLPSEITFQEALMLFRYLFDLSLEDSFEQLYENENHSIDNFYIGNLYFCENYIMFQNDKINFYDYNSIYKQLLMKGSAKLKDIHKFQTKKEDENYRYYDYLIYECLFYKYKNKLLNLNDNQFYGDNQILNKEINFGENFFEIIMSLDDFFKGCNHNYTKKNISLRKALTLFKRYNKSMDK